MTCNIPEKSQIPQLLSAWKEVFGEFGRFWEDFLEAGFSRQRCLCLTEDEEILATLTWMDCWLEEQKLAYVYAVMTTPAHRGRGLCRQLMAQTHQHLKKQGYASALLVPADEDLQKMYRSMGYRNGTRLREFSCQAGETGASLNPLTAEEFAVHRREFLHPGSVLQEGESLSFLARQACFFQGEDFLLTCHKSGGTLKGLELLGNTAAAPGILKTLGCKDGTFRCPGEGKEFAMFCPLTEDAKIPQYFAFDFD